MIHSNKSYVLAATAAVCAALPVWLPAPPPLKWLLFAVLLATAVFICHQYLSAGLAGLTLALPLAAAAYGVWEAAQNSLHLAALSLAAALALALGVISFFLRARVRVRVPSGHSGPSESSEPLGVAFRKSKKMPPSIEKTTIRKNKALPIQALPTTGEVIMSSRKQDLTGRPRPQFIEPTWQQDFRSISGMDEFKKKLRAAAFECAGVDDRNGILLHGEPGNGKTVFAQAIAGELGFEFISIQHRKMKWIGEESENLINQLKEAALRAPCVVFFDEADAVFAAREGGPSHGSSREHEAIIANMLTFLVDHRSLGIVFVAATNHLDAIDPAIRRPGRFDFVFEVPNPDLAAREGLIRVGINKARYLLTVPEPVIKSLARRWNGFNTSTILAIPAQIPQYIKDTGKTDLGFDDFMAMQKRQQGNANKVAETTKSFADMSFVPEQAAAIKNLISRMDRSFEIEEAGGDAPSGALFYGDPGTGKTESARMIAKETKWAFFPLTGPDIVRDPDIIEKTLKKVRNARPAIIFIDEADDLLGDRATSPYKAATNKLLAAMDGAGGRLSDLLWIASTNFPEASDAAVVRSGRFTEKIKFFLPGDDALLKFAKEFLTDPKRNAVMSVSWDELAEVLRGYSIADASGILMQAWNLTLLAGDKVDRTNPFTLETVLKARQMITL